MDDPVREITDIVLRLTQGSPKVQEETINKYFTTNASFTHPFCRTGSFEGSRLLIHGVFRWYKIMSPRIESKVNGIAYDQANLTLYVNISQVFAIWFVPFHRAPVTLTTQLQLVKRTSPNTTHPTDLSNSKYYIQLQNDLYPVDQFVRFVAPWGVGDAVVYFWHFFATLFCVLLSVLFAPFSRLMERWAEGKLEGIPKVIAGGVEGIEKRRMLGALETGRQAADGIHEVANGVKRSLEHTEAQMRKGYNESERQHEDHGQKQFGNMQVVT